MTPPRDVAASIRARLLAVAHAQDEPFEYLLVRFALERWLERLGRSRFADEVVLKGATCLRVWMGGPHRRTRDLDLTVARPLSPEQVVALFQQVCGTAGPDDGLAWSEAPPEVQAILGATPAGGVRLRTLARLGDARIHVQIDVGLGDVVVPAPERAVLPPLLPLPAPRVLAYRPEPVIAEKLHAMVWLGERNTRLKDHVDLWAIARRVALDGRSLAAAIGATFASRRTPIPVEMPTGLAESFVTPARVPQWTAMRRRWGAPWLPDALGDVLADLRAFLGWPLLAAARPDAPAMTWPPGGPWIPRHGDVVRERRARYGRPAGRRWQEKRRVGMLQPT